MSDKLGAVIVPAQYGLQSVERESLTEDGRRLQGLLVTRFELIEAGLYQALYLAWHPVVGTLFGMAQKLLQKQRIATGAIKAALRQLAKLAKVIICEHRRLAIA